jgi:hypothetical protein
MDEGVGQMSLSMVIAMTGFATARFSLSAPSQKWLLSLRRRQQGLRLQ